MKKIVWENKSNGQLCVTIPKNSGINDGDIVSIEKQKIKKVVYSSVTADFFHYGHLTILQRANELGDIHICGVLTNEAIRAYRKQPIADLRERMAIISNLRCVDRVLIQNDLNPMENLKKIKQEFPEAQLIAVYGLNWKKIPAKEQIIKLGCKIVQLPIYEKLSPTNVLNKIIRLYKNG